MSLPVRVTIRSNRFPFFRQQYPRALGHCVARAALAVEARWKANIVQKHVIDTGNYLNSIHAEKESDLHWAVGTSVHYAPYLEYGTYKMAARPCAMPAAQYVHPLFIADVRKTLGAVA